MSGASESPLLNRFLSEEEASRLYEQNPQLRRSYEDFCPTCATTGTFFWDGEERECFCREQLQLHKHYLAAGIGVIYQRLSWDDYEGDPEAKEQALRYLNRHELHVRRGTGMLFTGSVGTGKTTLATLMLKDLVVLGYSCYSVTFASLVEMFTAGWRDRAEQRWFQKKIRMSDVLLLDDLGREFRNRSKLSETTFDDVIRSRTQAGRPTFITTNLNEGELHEGYGSGALSLLSENSLIHEFDGTDYRPLANERLLREVETGIIRPIF